MASDMSHRLSARARAVSEVGQLSGQSAFVDVVATGALRAWLVPPDRLRMALISDADLGERIMRALMLRRISLIEAGAGNAILIGKNGSKDVLRLQNFLTRNSQPNKLLDPEHDEDAAQFVEQLGLTSDELPVATCPDGCVLHNPSITSLAAALGMSGTDRSDEQFDLAVVGAGPVGLSAAVYASSEGLSVAVLDGHAHGGQAGASTRIENYLGFPTGISGQALMSRALLQAQKFGAKMIIPATIKKMRRPTAARTFPARLGRWLPLAGELRRCGKWRVISPSGNSASPQFRRSRNLVLSLRVGGADVRGLRGYRRRRWKLRWPGLRLSF
jgi:thioredoxin reductase (NADPH)